MAYNRDTKDTEVVEGELWFTAEPQ